MNAKAVWERFYWCRSGCNTWHDVETSSGVHFSMVVDPQKEPTERNFPGTAEELARMRAWLAIRRSDAVEERATMERHIDAVLEAGADGGERRE